jgi:arylsulfatase A-like enzyme
LKPPCFLCIVVDCLRPDAALRMTLRRDSALGRLADAGVTFSNVKATTTVTTPCFATLFTGLYPHRHGLRGLRGYRVSPGRVLLPEVLARSGYHTYAYFAGPVLPETGLHRGFQEVECRATTAEKERLEPSAFLTGQWGRALRQRLRGNCFEPPWALFVHLWELHKPPRLDKDILGQSAFARRTYHRALRCLDQELRKLFDLVADDTVIVLTGDHGENLPLVTVPRGRLHGPVAWMVRRLRLPKRAYVWDHSFALYDWILTVPLFLRGQALPRAGTVPQQVRQVDLAPTILEMLGIEPPPGLDGRSLLPLLRGEDPGDRVGYFELLPLDLDEARWRVGLHDGRWKYSYAPKAPEPGERLVNVVDDPKERKNLHGTYPDVSTRLRSGILELYGGTEPTLAGCRLDADDSAVVADQLRALGYL